MQHVTCVPKPNHQQGSCDRETKILVNQWKLLHTYMHKQALTIHTAVALVQIQYYVNMYVPHQEGTARHYPHHSTCYGPYEVLSCH